MEKNLQRWTQGLDNMVHYFCTKHPRRYSRNAIEDKPAVDKDMPPDSAILAPTGHVTTWGSLDLHGHVEAWKVPLAEDKNPQADELEGSRAIPMAGNSGDESPLSLGSCCSGCTLGQTPTSPPHYAGYRATLLLPPT